ncbi:unnamed protein product, partial [Laminaria digitata]
GRFLLLYPPPRTLVGGEPPGKPPTHCIQRLEHSSRGLTPTAKRTLPPPPRMVVLCSPIVPKPPSLPRMPTTTINLKMTAAATTTSTSKSHRRGFCSTSNSHRRPRSTSNRHRRPRSTSNRQRRPCSTSNL